MKYYPWCMNHDENGKKRQKRSDTIYDLYVEIEQHYGWIVTSLVFDPKAKLNSYVE